MPTTYNFDRTINNFLSRVPVIVWTKTGTLYKGEWSWGDEEDKRSIPAVCTFYKVVDQNIQLSGLFSRGRLNIITKEWLYYTDRDRDKQSWVHYLSHTYKITGEGGLSDIILAGNAAYHSYDCELEIT